MIHAVSQSLIDVFTRWGTLDSWTLAVAGVCAVACSLVGVYLVLRKQSMLGDAISHAVLPGLALAFLVTGSRSVVPMLIGAAIAGLLTVLISQAISRVGKVTEDASTGIVFTAFFAAGVLLMSSGAARNVDLDPNCVLYGNIELVTLDTVKVPIGDSQIVVPRTFPALLGALAVVLAGVVLFYKELKITSFDSALATSMGIATGAVSVGLLAGVAGLTVVSFEAVGSILVVAMLIAPGATALLLTHRLGVALVLAAGLALLATFLGYVLAVAMNTSIAGMIATMTGVLFAVAVVLSPRDGVIAQAQRRLRLQVRIRSEDVLGSLYRLHEGTEAKKDVAAICRGGIGWLAQIRLRHWGLTRQSPEGLVLTEKGLRVAQHLVRSHRLWETYLNQKLGLPADHVHDPSERMEHYLSEGMQDEIQREIDAAIDPQGKVIPPPSNRK